MGAYRGSRRIELNRRWIAATRAAAALLLFMLAALGCVAFPVKRSPRLAHPRVAPELPSGMSIRLIVHDAPPGQSKAGRSLDRVRSKFPYLASATAGTENPDYTIELSVQYRESGSRTNEFAALSLCVFPMIYTREVTVRATIADRDGTRLGEVQSMGRSKQVVQMHLLWVLPIAAPLAHHTDRQMWNNTFRDVFIQAGELIAARDPNASHSDPGRHAQPTPISSSPVVDLGAALGGGRQAQDGT